MTKEIFNGIVERGISFTSSPYFVSSTGHGTTVATIISQMCPGCRLYTAKIDMATSEGQVSINLETAAEVRRLIYLHFSSARH